MLGAGKREEQPGLVGLLQFYGVAPEDGCQEDLRG